MLKNTKKIRKNKLKNNKTFYKRKNNRKSKNNKIKHKKYHTRKISKKGGDLNAVYDYTVNPALKGIGYVGKTIGDTTNYVGQNIGFTSNDIPKNTHTSSTKNEEFEDRKYKCEKYKNDEENYQVFDLEDYLKISGQRKKFVELYNNNIRKKYDTLEDLNQYEIKLKKYTKKNNKNEEITYNKYDFDQLDKSEVPDVLNILLKPYGIEDKDFCIQEDEDGEIDAISDFYIKKDKLIIKQ
jgi:hypothetical protein